MFKFIIGFFLFILIIIFSIGITGIGLLSRLFGSKKRNQSSQQNYRQQNHVDFERKEKIFDKSEGEYVDFEEIDEDVEK